MQNLLGRMLCIFGGGNLGAVDEAVEHSAGVKKIGQ
jgi:hypothetical protein